MMLELTAKASPSLHTSGYVGAQFDHMSISKPPAQRPLPPPPATAEENLESEKAQTRICYAFHHEELHKPWLARWEYQTY